MRIAKALALFGVCSRRKAEELIQQGRVSVNYQTISTPVFFISENDQLKVDGQSICMKSPVIKIWKFFKPKKVITSTNDEQGRLTVFDLLPKNIGRVMTIGRLDYNTEGLLLLTNSGAIARKFEIPASGYQRKYLCRSFGYITANMTTELAQGVNIDGVQYRHITMKINESKNHNNWSEITLTEGKNREIRKVFTHYGLQVNRLIRISYGPYHLENMKPKELKEVKYVT